MTKIAISLALCAAFLVVPLLLPPYMLHVGTVVLFNITSTAALYVIMRMGYLSFGHAGFITVGAYTSAMIAAKFGLSSWLGFMAAGLVSGAVAWGLGAVTLKLRGIYFSMAVFAFAEVVSALIRSSDFLGGPGGITDIPKPYLFTLPLDGYLSFFYLVLIITGSALVFLYRLQDTPFGFRLLSMRTSETEALARSIGINVRLYKTMALCLSGALCGLVGALHAHYLEFISPFVFTFLNSTDLVVFAMVGGLSSFWGPLLGAGLLTALGEVLFSAGYYKSLIYAIVLLVVILVVPGGIVSVPKLVLNRVRSRRQSASASSRSDLELIVKEADPA